MTIDSTSYRSIGNITKWLVKFNIAGIIVLLALTGTILYLALSSAFYDSMSYDVYALAFLFALLIISIITLVVIILIVIFELWWYYRANKNIHSFGANEVISSRMAVIWWFIPIANLWKPYRVTQQIWKASNPEVKLIQGTEWKKDPDPKIIFIWWILVIVSGIGSSVFGNIAEVGNFQMSYDESEQREQSRLALLYESLITIPFIIIFIISTILFIRIIKQISKWQEQKSGMSV
jgi:heme/copper-type cytochrome/quinol oxidase subunit 2